MSEPNTFANTEPETSHCRELALDALETVSAGGGKATVKTTSNGQGTGNEYLVVTMQTAFITSS